MLYTLAGGLKATFMASYIHTAIIFIVRSFSNNKTCNQYAL